MLKTAILFICLFVFSFTSIACFGNSEIRLISPIGAVARSIIPGWGQIYTNHKLKGMVIFLSIGILGAGGVRTDATYRDYYNNKYRPAVLNESDQADFYFDEANQYYKLSRFLLYAAGGIWAYSIVDAYVDAHVYNAKQQLKILEIDDSKIKQLKHTDEMSYWPYNEDFALRTDLPIFSRTNPLFIPANTFYSVNLQGSD